jgi:hypothetical protein
MSNSSNKSKQNSNSDNYINNTITKYMKSFQNSSNKQGGRRRSSKKSKSEKPKLKSKRTKRRQMYKYKGGSSCMDGPAGIEKSALAFTASPISNIKAVGPTSDQMIGQPAYPAWRFSE